MQEILYLDLFKKPLSEIFVLSIIDQHIKEITGNWYLKLTPTVPFIAPVNNPANKTKSKYLLESLFMYLNEKYMLNAHMKKRIRSITNN